MAEEVRHYTINGRYRVTIERAASSTKGIDGFKVEANGDSFVEVLQDADKLYAALREKTMPPPLIPVKES